MGLKARQAVERLPAGGPRLNRGSGSNPLYSTSTHTRAGWANAGDQGEAETVRLRTVQRPAAKQSGMLGAL